VLALYCEDLTGGNAVRTLYPCLHYELSYVKPVPAMYLLYVCMLSLRV
jgi:hypothetical protein